MNKIISTILSIIGLLFIVALFVMFIAWAIEQIPKRTINMERAGTVQEEAQEELRFNDTNSNLPSSLWIASANSPELLRIVTAYTLRPEETDDTPCIGAWGDNLCRFYCWIEDEICVDKNDYTFSNYPRCCKIYNVCASNEFSRGTLLRLGDKEVWAFECVVLDRMNFRYSNRIDILMDTKENAINFGVQELKVEVIN